MSEDRHLKIPDGWGYRYIAGEKVLVRLYGPGGHYHNPRYEIERLNDDIKQQRKGINGEKI